MRKAATKADDVNNLSGKRDLRNRPTKAEFKMWSMIKDKSLGVKFIRSEKIQYSRNDYGYYADYVCYERDLIVEVDNPIIAERANNQERNDYFAHGAFVVLRFKDKDILGNPVAVLAKIKEAIKSQEL
jgi:very-short-patch-repair endonuclease